ncbi:MAG: hypothetical protein HUN05_14065 [Desulfobacter sp.]|nr:MAG: hypothetical protein HUN05_14065 [Desulfobacter sp.]
MNKIAALLMVLFLAVCISNTWANSYKGCYRDSASRDLNGYTFNSNNMTTQGCMDVCKAKGFRYAATQYVSHCFCSNTYGKYGPSQGCNMKCSGNAAEICGGGWANSVYELASFSSPAKGKKTSAGAKEIKIFSNNNIATVYNLRTTHFTLTQPMIITRIATYHWNDGKGTKAPGKIGIRGIGAWQAKGSPGMHNTRNAYWTVSPNLKLAAGTYAITDSDPATWSQNAKSQGLGIVDVFGRPVSK